MTKFVYPGWAGPVFRHDQVKSSNSLCAAAPRIKHSDIHNDDLRGRSAITELMGD